MSGTKCCKGHTYKCDVCKGKFCERCQHSEYYGEYEVCYGCYLKQCGLNVEKKDQEVKIKDDRISQLEGQIFESSDRYFAGKQQAYLEIKNFVETHPTLDQSILLEELNKRMSLDYQGYF